MYVNVFHNKIIDSRNRVVSFVTFIIFGEQKT